MKNFILVLSLAFLLPIASAHCGKCDKSCKKNCASDCKKAETGTSCEGKECSCKESCCGKLKDEKAPEAASTGKETDTAPAAVPSK